MPPTYANGASLLGAGPAHGPEVSRPSASASGTSTTDEDIQ